MTLFPDAELDNADWTKRTWDADTNVPPEFRREYWEQYPLEELRRLVGLPVWAVAPDYAREIAERRLAE